LYLAAFVNIVNTDAKVSARKPCVYKGP